MPNQHKHPPIAFRPTEGQRDQLLRYAETTGMPVNRILRDAFDIFCATLVEHSSLRETPRACIQINTGGNTSAITLERITLTYVAGICRAEASSDGRIYMTEADSATGAVIALLAARLGYDAKVQMRA